MSNTVRKENDWLLARMANPQMSVDNFEEVGLNATNTSLETEDTYAKSQTIQNMPEFLTDGVFDKNKFHAAYVEVQSSYNELAHDTYLNELNTAVNYYKDDIFAPDLNREQQQRRLAPETGVIKLLNPMLKKHSNLYLGSVLDSDKSMAEIMQSNRVLLNAEDVDYEKGDFSKAKWGSSINDISLQSNPLEYFKSWGDTYVQAVWHEDGTHIDPTDGLEKEHHKGDYKINADGDYFYEKANGRDVYNEKVLSRWDYLTVDGTKANTFDFMDSDDKKKSWYGTLTREIFELAPLFIPYVGPAYMTARLGIQAASVANTIAKMTSDNFNLGWEWTNKFEGFNKALEQGTSEYSLNNTVTAENLISMAGLVATLLLEQRAIFKSLTAANSWIKNGKNLNNEKGAKELFSKFLQKYLEDARRVNGAQNVNEIVTLSTKYASAEMKALQKQAQAFGEEASRLYMTGFTVMDAYNEAKENGASDTEAAILTLGYAAAEYGILKTDVGKWIMPEQKMERIHLRNVVRTLTEAPKNNNYVDKNIKTNWAKSLMQKAAKACKADYEGVGSNPTVKDWIGAFASNALSEGVEETSEELAYDLVKTIGNAVSYVIGSDTDYKPFENGLSNYGMSFLGGFFGGGLALIDPSFRKALKFDHNMTYDHAFLEFVGMIGEGKANDLREAINKTPVSNQFLTKTNPDTPSITMQDAQGGINDNMDKQSKNILLDMVDFCENVLNKHSVNITQSLLLQESTYLRDLQADALANSSFAAGYIKKFNKARTDLIEAEINYYNATHPENVVTSEQAKYEKDHEDEIKKAREAVVKADEEVLKYINGEYRPILIRGVMKEMMPDYVKPYGISNVDLYAQVMYGKSFKDLSDSEKAEAQKSWENFKNTEHQDHMISVDEVSHGMAKVVSPLLANIETDYFGKVTSDKIKKLNNLIETRRLYTLLADENALMEYASREAASQGINPAGLNYNDEFYKLANRLLSKGENLNSIDGEISPEVLLASAFVPVVQEIDPNLSTEELEEIRQQNQAILDADPVYQHIKEILSYKDPGALGDTEALIAAKTEKVQSDRLRAYIAELMLKPVQELTKETFLRLDKAVNDKVNSKEFLDTIEELVNNLVNEANNAIDEFNLNAPEGEPKKEHLSDKDISRIRRKAIADERNKFISEELPKIRKEVVGNFNVDSIYDLVQDVIKQGFVHPELRSLLMQGLNYAVDYVTSIDTGEDSTLEKYKQEQLNTLSEQMVLLNELPSIPIIDILDKFLLGITDGTGMSISDILKKADDILKAPDIGDVMLSDPEVKALQDGVSVLQMFDALLLGATSDDVTIEHRISLNAMINALEEQYGIPKEKRSNLATLPSNIVALIRLDLKPILGKLQFMLLLNALNSGQKAKNQNKVSTKGYKIMYSKIYSKLLGHTIDDSWDKDGALSKLKATLDGLDLLLSKTANYSKEGMIAFETLRIAMENALYDFMQTNKDKSIEEKAALFAELAFDDNERQILTTDTENLSDALFMYWFMAVTGVKGDSFLNEYKKAYTANPDLAPFASLELGIRLAYTALLNGDYISQFVNAVRDVIKNKYKNIDKIAHDDISWHKDLPYEATFMPRYLNTILIEGVPGSGKSKGILKMLVLMARDNEELNKALLNNVFVAHINKKEAEDLGTGSGFKKDQFTAMDRRDLLKYVTGGKYDTDKLVYEGTTVKYDPKDFIYNEKTGLLDYNIGIAEGLTNIPSLIIIDEIGRYTTVEMDILDKFVRKYGIQIIAMGDLDLTRTVAKSAGEVHTPKGNFTFEASLYRGNFIHGIKLGLSVRAANNLKALNQKALQTMLPTLKGLPTLSGGSSGGELASALRKAGGLKLRYLENDKGLYGDKIVGTWGKELSQEVKDSIENMFRTAGKEKIGFAYRKVLDPDKITPLQKYLFEGSFTDINGEKVAFKDRLDLKPDGDSLGSESKYYIIEPDTMDDLDPKGTEFFWTSLYTGMSRSKQGSLIVLTEENYRGLAGYTSEDYVTEALVKAAQLVSSVKSTNKVDDTLTNTMIKAIAANRTAILDDILTGDIETPKFVKRENYSATQGVPKKVEKAPDQVLKGSDNQPFVPDNTPSENEQFSDDFDLLKEDGTLNLISYTHSALEVGAIKESDGTYVLPPNAQDRIDGVNGLVKILRSGASDLATAFSKLNAGNALIDKFINILNACKYNVKDYNDLVSKILQVLGDDAIVDSVEITYVKMSLDAHDKIIKDRRSRRALILDVEEELINAWKGEKIEKATPQVAKLGYTVFTKTKDGKKASLFIPMLTLPNFITIFTSSKFINPAAGSIYEDLLKLWIATNQSLSFTRPENTSNPLLFLPPNQSKIRDLAIELNKRLNDYIHNTLQSLPDSDVRKKYIKSIQALSNLIKLFEYPQDTVGFTGNHDIFTQYLTPSGPFIQHVEKGVKNYMRVGYESDTEYRKLSEFAGKKGLTISKPMISYTGQITVDGVTFSYVDPGKPFVLVSDLSTANPDWLKSAFLENLNKAGKAVAESMGPGNSSEIDQRFAFNFKGGYFAENIPEEFRRIKIVYVVPPTATIQAYCEDILKALTEGQAPTIGNDFDIFRILAIQEKDAEGKEGLEKYVFYNLTRPKGKDGKPLTSGSLFDRHKKVFELINDLQKLEELVNKAKEEGDIEKVGELQQKQLEILRGDVFSGELKPFNNKANMNIVLADAISHFSGGKRVANKPEDIRKVVSLIEASGIKEIYYNPTVDKSKLNEVETDPIIELNEISGKEYTINGDLLQTALFGNMSPIINALITNIETDIQNTPEAYFDARKKFILSKNMNIFSGEEISNKAPEEPAEEKEHKRKVKEIKLRFINGLPSNRAFFNKNMSELIEDYDNDSEEISTEYLVQKAEELKRYYVLTAPLGEPDCKILYISEKDGALRSDFLKLKNIVEPYSYANSANPIEFIIRESAEDDDIFYKVTEESNGNLKLNKISVIEPDGTIIHNPVIFEGIKIIVNGLPTDMQQEISKYLPEISANILKLYLEKWYLLAFPNGTLNTYELFGELINISLYDDSSVENLLSGITANKSTIELLTNFIQLAKPLYYTIGYRYGGMYDLDLEEYLDPYIQNLTQEQKDVNTKIAKSLLEWFKNDITGEEEAFGIEAPKFINRLISEKGIDYVIDTIKANIKDDSPLPLKYLLEGYEDYLFMNDLDSDKSDNNDNSNNNDDSDNNNNGLDNKGSNTGNEKTSLQEYLKPFVEGLMTNDARKALNKALEGNIDEIKEADIAKIPKIIKPFLNEVDDDNPIGSIGDFMNILAEATYDGGEMPEPIVALTNAYYTYIDQNNNKEELNKNDGECAPKIIPTNSIAEDLTF